MQLCRSFSFLLLVFAATGCGKFADKFSRINGDVTRVHFDNRNGDIQPLGTLNGGLMIYFMDANDLHSGRAFGFSSEDAVLAKSVLIPNGTYKVYALGWDGANKIEGQSRCGFGDAGQTITLSGAAKTVSIGMSATNCSFGSASYFATANGANDSSNTNFDTANFTLCDGAAVGCSPSTQGSWYVKAEVLAGVGLANSFSEVSADTISGCSTASGSSNIATSFRLPVGSTQFSPPVRVSFYDNAACTGTASGTYQFLDGLHMYIDNASSGGSYKVYQPATSSTFTLYLNKSF